MTVQWGEGEPRGEPALKLPPVIWVLLTLIVAAHVYVSLQPPDTRNMIAVVFGFVPARYLEGGSTTYPGGLPGVVWPLFSHGFLHGNFPHLLFNSLWLMAVGTPLARRLGTWPFLIFYFLCGAASAGAHLATNWGSPIPVVGASGAIAGCMAGALRILFSSTTRFFITKNAGVGRLAPITDPRLVSITLIWILLNAAVGLGVMPMPGAGDASVAWQAHIGGFLAGLILLPIFDRWAGGPTRLFPSI